MPVNTKSAELFQEIKDIQQPDDQESEVETPLTTEAPGHQTDHISPDSNLPAPKKRGRPRKSSRPPDPPRRDAPTRSSRASALKARERWNADNNIGRVSTQVTRDRSFYYRSANRPYKDNDECCVTVFAGWDPVRHYWWYPPPGNYGFLEQADWHWPELEEWAQRDDGAHAVLEDEESSDEEFHSPELPQAASPRPGASAAAWLQDYDPVGPWEEDVAEPLDQATVAELSPGTQFRTLARNPRSASQVNLSRVVNIGGLPEVDVQAEPRRSGRKKQKPDRYKHK